PRSGDQDDLSVDQGAGRAKTAGATPCVRIATTPPRCGAVGSRRGVRLRSLLSPSSRFQAVLVEVRSSASLAFGLVASPLQVRGSGLREVSRARSGRYHHQCEHEEANERAGELHSWIPRSRALYL